MLLMLNPAPLSAAVALGLIGIGYGIVSGLAAGAIAVTRAVVPHAATDFASRFTFRHSRIT